MVKNLKTKGIVFKTNILERKDGKVGEAQSFTFQFTNLMDKPLIIANVKSSCGCTVADWNSNPILPGRKSNIKLIYVSDDPTRYYKKAIVESNAPNSKEVLVIKGNLIE